MDTVEKEKLLAEANELLDKIENTINCIVSDLVIVLFVCQTHPYYILK